MTIKVKLTALACAVLPLAMTAGAQSLTPAEEGRRVFLANNCYGCHSGRGGGGSFVGAPNLRSERPELGDLSEAIREGEDRGMPSFRLLTQTDINNLSAYFQSMRTPSEPIFNIWWEPVPTAGLLLPPVPYLYASTGEKRPNRPSR